MNLFALVLVVAATLGYAVKLNEDDSVASFEIDQTPEVVNQAPNLSNSSEEDIENLDAIVDTLQEAIHGLNDRLTVMTLTSVLADNDPSLTTHSNSDDEVANYFTREEKVNFWKEVEKRFAKMRVNVMKHPNRLILLDFVRVYYNDFTKSFIVRRALIKKLTILDPLFFDLTIFKSPQYSTINVTPDQFLTLMLGISQGVAAVIFGYCKEKLFPLPEVLDKLPSVMKKVKQMMKDHIEILAGQDDLDQHQFRTYRHRVVSELSKQMSNLLPSPSTTIQIPDDNNTLLDDKWTLWKWLSRNI